MNFSWVGDEGGKGCAAVPGSRPSGVSASPGYIHRSVRLDSEANTFQVAGQHGGWLLYHRGSLGQHKSL